LPVLGGFIFLVVVLDLFSRKVIGWSVGDRLDAELSGEGCGVLWPGAARGQRCSSTRIAALSSRRRASARSWRTPAPCRA
jgi:transposase InsO family protein